jgi:hypothetical protein
MPDLTSEAPFWAVGSVILLTVSCYVRNAFTLTHPREPDYFGRRGAIFITALCLIATPIGSGFTKSWQGLFACR